jgi:hypothetical protein
MLLRTLVLGIVATAFLALAQVALAQYPPPDGAVSVSPSDPIPELGSNTTLTVAVVDSAGAPIAGAVCTAEITSQPGSTASVVDPAVTTGADGIAKIDVAVGDSPGAVVVGITCGDLEASIVLSAGATPGPPDAGSGGLLFDDESGSFSTYLIGGSLLIVVAGALVGSLALRKRQSD